MKLEKEQRIWNTLGQMDPLWAILVDPDKKFGGWDPAEFFETGQREIDGVLRGLPALGAPLGRERALDFGCGVGRLTRALSLHFGEVHGVDISLEMIARARELNEDRENCHFVANADDDLRIFDSDRFDFVFSIMVLQHLPSRETIAAYVAEFLRVLRPGGLLAFQLPSHLPLRQRLQPRRRLYSVLRALGISDDFLYRRAGLTPIRMLSISEAEVVDLVKARGGRVVRVDRTDHAGAQIESRMYFVTKSGGSGDGQ